MTNRRLQKSLKKFSNKKLEVPTIIQGTLGMPIGGQKLVEVPNRAGYVYVKLRDNQSEFIQAYNSEVSTIYDLPVLVTRQNNIYKVIGRDQDRYRDWGTIPYLPKHGGQHSFNNALGMGADVTWIYSQQIMPLLGYPSGSNGSNGIIVAPYVIRDLDGNWKYAGNTGTPDISMYRPTASTGAVMVLVYIDTVSGNPYLLVGSGTSFHSGLTGTADIARFIPKITNPNWLPDTAVRLTTGTTQLTWTNLYDVRPFLQVIPTGSGGGGSVNTGTLNSLYLRLDTTNDPLTGRLRIIPTALNTDGLYINTEGDASAIAVEQFSSGTSTSRSAISVLRESVGDSSTVFASPLLSLEQNRISGSATGEMIVGLSDGTKRFAINPTVQGTGTLAYIDGDFALSPDGLLLLLKNHNSPRYYVNASGTAYSNGVPLIKEAPVNGLSYVRKNAGWEIAVTGSSGGATAPVSGSIVLQDDGQILGSILYLNARTNITASISGSVGAIDANTVLLNTDDFTTQIDGSKTTFGPTTLLPVASTARLYYNGVRQRYLFHYTISGSYVQTLYTPTTGSVLLLDYNESSTTGTLTSIIGVQDEGILKGNVTQLNFVGGGVQATVAGTTATIAITGSSGLVFLEGYTVNNAATMDFTMLSSLYDEYLLIVTNFKPVTNGADLWLRVGTGTAPVYQTGALYEYETENYFANGGTPPANGLTSAADSKIIVWQGNDSGTARGNSFDIRIRDPLSNTMEKAFSWQGNGVLSAANTRRYKIDGMGTWDSTNIISALRLMYSSGNISIGTGRLYGISKT